MRDDALELVAELSRSYQKKIELLRTLLRSESDKLYYGKSDNIEKVIEIIRNDAPVIEEVDAVDYDIAKSEYALSSLIGIKPRELYGVLEGAGETRGLLSLRSEARKSVERLFQERTVLIGRLEGASRVLNRSIDELSRIGRLKRDDHDE